MSHILVVGGTGMLRKVCLHMCKSNQTVTVIARNQKRLKSLKFESEHFKGIINPITLDYKISGELSEKINNAIDKFGPVSTAVSWIHTSVAPDTVRIIAESINKKNRRRLCKFYWLLSSATADPSVEKKDTTKEFADLKNISFHTVLLGFKIENGHSRWLTDDEICRGVIDAIEEDQMSSVIGTVEPWDKRP